MGEGFIQPTRALSARLLKTTENCICAIRLASGRKGSDLALCGTGSGWAPDRTQTQSRKWIHRVLSPGKQSNQYRMVVGLSTRFGSARPRYGSVIEFWPRLTSGIVADDDGCSPN